MKIELKRVTMEDDFVSMEVQETRWRLFRTPGVKHKKYVRGRDLQWYDATESGWEAVGHALHTRLSELLQQHSFLKRKRE